MVALSNTLRLLWLQVPDGSFGEAYEVLERESTWEFQVGLSVFPARPQLVCYSMGRYMVCSCRQTTLTSGSPGCGVCLLTASTNLLGLGLHRQRNLEPAALMPHHDGSGSYLWLANPFFSMLTAFTALALQVYDKYKVRYPM